MDWSAILRGVGQLAGGGPQQQQPSAVPAPSGPNNPNSPVPGIVPRLVNKFSRRRYSDNLAKPPAADTGVPDYLAPMPDDENPYRWGM